LFPLPSLTVAPTSLLDKQSRWAGASVHPASSDRATHRPTDSYTGFKLTHRYDALGNRLQTTLPNGRTIDTQRYGSGHWHGSLWQGNPLVDIERDHLHRETRRQLGGAARQPQRAPLIATRSYDPQSRLAAMALNKGSERLRQRSYQYDAGGNLTDIQDGQRGATYYRYDPLGQLLSAVQPHLSETFAFDPAGNLLDGVDPAAADVPAFGGLARHNNTDHIERLDPLTEQPRPGTRPPALPKVIHNLLKQYLEHSYEYDIQGNTIVKRLNAGLTSPNQAAELAFAYDADNHLVRATRTWAMPGGKAQLTAQYRYDAFGRRIAKQVTEGGQTHTTLFVWDGDVLVQEIDAGSTVTYLYEPESFVPLARIESAGGIDSYHYAAQAMYLPYEAQWDVPQARHIHDAHVGAYWARQEHIKEQRHQQAWRQRLHQANQAAANDRIYHYQCDHLGTPLELMDETGKVVWAARYKAWGRVLRYDTRDVEQPLRFQGQYEDAETGLHYNRHRYYDPDQARYVTQDPIGLLGGANLYAYAPNAAAWVDPLGLAKTKGGCDPCCGSTVSAQAQAFQGKGDYPGVDSYTNVVLKKGTILYSLYPGGTPGFAVTNHALIKAGGAMTVYYNATQVTLDPGKDAAGLPRKLRTNVRAYRVNEDICVAKGKALKNSQHGPGGATQYYVSPLDAGKLTPGKIRPI
jgi:RHS repeat-associated protein